VFSNLNQQNYIFLANQPISFSFLFCSQTELTLMMNKECRMDSLGSFILSLDLLAPHKVKKMHAAYLLTYM